MNPPPTPTQHTLERYMQRSGCVKVIKSLNRIERLALRAKPISPQHIYADGWIMKVAKGQIVTMYKPKFPSQLRKIHKAMQQFSHEPGPQ